MRVLYLTLLDFPRRVANRGQIFNMCQGFAFDCDCTLAITHSHLEEVELRSYYGVDDNFEIYCFGEKVTRSRLLAVLKMLWLFITKRPDLIYVREEKLAYLLSFLPWKYVYEVHELFPMQTKTQMRAVNKSEKTVAIMESLRTELVSLGAASEKCVVENLAINDKYYRDELEFEIPDAMQPASGVIKIIYSGRFSVQKGVYCLVDAMEFLPPNFELVLLGGYQGEPEALEAYSREKNVAGRVTVVGHVAHSQVYRYLRSADILALPNSGNRDVLRYTNPLKLYEYLAAAKPIVASRIEALTTVLPEGEMATYFEPDNAQDLARAIREVTDNPEAAAKRVQRGREFVGGKTWRARVRRILSAVA